MVIILHYCDQIFNSSTPVAHYMRYLSSAGYFFAVSYILSVVLNYDWCKGHKQGCIVACICGIGGITLPSSEIQCFKGVYLSHCPGAGTQELMEAMLEAGKYIYLSNLQLLSRHVPASPMTLPSELSPVNTPLMLRVWQSHLQSHPDKTFCHYLLDGFKHGLRIGYDYANHTCRAASRNMASALENPTVVDDYLAKEKELGWIIGPITPGSVQLQINHFGVIPKSNQPGKWQLIVDLSHPTGHSINDGIEPELCFLSYASVDDAVAIIQRLDKGTVLAKLDLESAYRIIPVHPDDRLLLGMEWRDSWFVDTALLFSLCFTPKTFTAMADGLLWIMAANGVKCALHYLDDYLFFGPSRVFSV